MSEMALQSHHVELMDGASVHLMPVGRGPDGHIRYEVQMWVNGKRQKIGLLSPELTNTNGSTTVKVPIGSSCPPANWTQEIGLAVFQQLIAEFQAAGYHLLKVIIPQTTHAHLIKAAREVGIGERLKEQTRGQGATWTGWLHLVDEPEEKAE